MKAQVKKPKIWTETGLKALGRLFKEQRERMDQSLDSIAALIEERTGQPFTKKNLSNLERASGEPKWRTLAIIAAAEIFTDPVTGRPISASDMADIAAETYFQGQDKEEFMALIGNRSAQILQSTDNNECMLFDLPYQGNTYQVAIIQPQQAPLEKSTIKILKEWYAVQSCPPSGLCCTRFRMLTDGKRRWTESVEVPMHYCSSS